MSLIAVYYCDSCDGEELKPHVELFPEGPQQISTMLARMRALHDAGKLFVGSISHTRDGVVKGVIEGKLPNGEPYTWRKRRP